MYSIMPIMSLVMEINGPVAMAGSTFNFSKVMGTSVPKMEANMTTAKRLMETGISNRGRSSEPDKIIDVYQQRDDGCIDDRYYRFLGYLFEDVFGIQ